MVRAAADAHGVLVEQAQARRRLARIDEPCAVWCRDGREFRRPRRDARHVLQKIQREALARQHGPRTAMHLRDDGARLQLCAILELCVEKDARLENLEHAPRDVDAREHARVLCVDDARRLHLGADNRERRDVAAADVLLKP